MEKDKTEKKQNSWEKPQTLGVYKALKPLLANLVLLLEDEKKRTVTKIQETKKVLEKMNSHERT